MQERRRKRLCYLCEDKWQQGHKCVKPKLYLLDRMNVSDSLIKDSIEEQVVLIDTIVDKVERCIDIASIAIQATIGTPKTL